MVALELQAQYEALVERAAGHSRAGAGLRERLTEDLSTARELVNRVSRALGQGEALTGLLEDGEGLVDRLEAQVYLIQEIGLEAFVSSSRTTTAE